MTPSLNLRDAFASEGGWPPDHLLRYAFETCADFEAAIELLSPRAACASGAVHSGRASGAARWR